MPAWIISGVVHAVMLFVMSLIVYASASAPEVEEPAIRIGAIPPPEMKRDSVVTPRDSSTTTRRSICPSLR